MFANAREVAMNASVWIANWYEGSKMRVGVGSAYHFPYVEVLGGANVAHCSRQFILDGFCSMRRGSLQRRGDLPHSLFEKNKPAQRIAALLVTEALLEVEGEISYPIGVPKRSQRKSTFPRHVRRLQAAASLSALPKENQRSMGGQLRLGQRVDREVAVELFR